MTRVAEYLMTNYYSRTDNPAIVPTEEQLELSIKNHADKFIVIEDKVIRGVGVFLTLTDDSLDRVMHRKLDIRDVDVLKCLAVETGNNVHFVILAADCYETIRLGLKQVMSLNPKTVSWFNPQFNKFHIYKVV